MVYMINDIINDMINDNCKEGFNKIMMIWWCSA